MRIRHNHQKPSGVGYNAYAMKKHVLFNTARAMTGVALLGGAVAMAQNAKPQATKLVPVPSDDGYTKTVKPFFNSYCISCHGDAKAKGNLRVDALAPNFHDLAAKEKWGEIVNVLNSHQMPPKGEKQPAKEEVGAVVDWITAQMVQSELARRDSAVVLRRLNREEYKNTIRDLTGVNFDVSGFPADPASGGFDNNGKALTISPLHMELYIEAARKILDRALFEGEQPEKIKWRFEPEIGGGDDSRITLPNGQRPIVHGGENPRRDGLTIMHHASWNLNPNVRDFSLPVEGEYIIRVRAAGRVPSRAEVVSSAEKILAKRRDEQDAQNPGGKRWTQEAFESDLKHFQTDRMYDYGPPRLKLIQDLAGQPRVLAEWDVDAGADAPKVYEFRTRFTTQSAGVTLEYAYSIPSELENFWMQNNSEFARPEVLLDWIEIEGPVYDAWPPSTHTRVLPVAQTNNERAYVRETLAKFMKKAWRRPVSAEEIDAKVALFDAVRKEKPSLVEALKIPMIAVLASPNFLYLSEPSTEAARPLNNYELATRLSYFLWSTTPDAELLRLADEGTLNQPAVLYEQTERLLKDTRSEALVRNFAGQWIGLREVGANPPSSDLYPQYDRHLEVSMVGESQAFFREILKRDLPVTSFIKSDFVTINERLARFYGIENVRGDQFRPVKVPAGVHRGGLATQASVLTITSNGTRTSPVKRGTWVMKTLLGTDPGLPVANAGDIPPKVPGADKATVRQRLAMHRERPQCARCHDKIDPLGLALENFNAAGQWREQEGFGYKGRISQDDPKIDASATMPDGTQFVGVEGLQNALLKQQDLFFTAMANRMYSYALGRELGLADAPENKAAAAHLKKHGTLRSLIRFVVGSKAFRTK
jgi:mono/diheme cytochrome c family protein